MRRAGRLTALLALAVLACISACGQPLYVARLGWAEAKILWRREPIQEVVRRPGVDADLRERLELVLAAREFARDQLGFRVGKSYTSYAEIAGHEATVHVVSAAYRDRLKSFTWWYPIAGRVPYRGFFDAAAAQAEARHLARRGLDVDVRPAIAFSTLGWFPDPLLSVTAEEKPVPLVATVLHELFHQTLYVAGEPAFNESAATFAGDRGAVAFFCHGPGADGARCDRARRGWKRTLARGRILDRLADKLRRLYASRPPQAVRERVREQLTALAAETLTRHHLGDVSDVSPPNNARLLGALLYATRLDEFEALAPGDDDPGPALRALVTAARGRADPFEALAGLAADRKGMGKLQNG